MRMETVDLPVKPPLEPMLAKAQTKVPAEAGVWSYEPKWDGFRALVFRDGDDVVLLSRSGKDLGRYFPEVSDSVRDELGAALRARRRDRRAPRDRRAHPAGLGVAEPAHPPRRVPGTQALRRRPRRTSSVSTRWPSATRHCSKSRSGRAARR